MLVRFTFLLSIRPLFPTPPCLYTHLPLVYAFFSPRAIPPPLAADRRLYSALLLLSTVFGLFFRMLGVLDCSCFRTFSLSSLLRLIRLACLTHTHTHSLIPPSTPPTPLLPPSIERGAPSFHLVAACIHMYTRSLHPTHPPTHPLSTSQWWPAPPLLLPPPLPLLPEESPPSASPA